MRRCGGDRSEVNGPGCTLLLLFLVVMCFLWENFSYLCLFEEKLE